MPYMYVLYVCLRRMPYMYALYVCLICMSVAKRTAAEDRCTMPYMYALYVCLICMPYMYACSKKDGGRRLVHYALGFHWRPAVHHLQHVALSPVAICG